MLVGPTGAEMATWMVGGPGPPDLALVDALAWLQLRARRLGCCIRLSDAGHELAELLDLAGLGREVGGKPEGGKKLRVQEGVEPGDPLA